MAGSRIVLDTSSWKTSSDFYSALLPRLGAPDWHGSNLDALWDSITGDDVNALEPPYVIVLTGRSLIPEPLRSCLSRFVAMIGDARLRGIDVGLIVEPALGLDAPP